MLTSTVIPTARSVPSALLPCILHPSSSGNPANPSPTYRMQSLFASRLCIYSWLSITVEPISHICLFLHFVSDLQVGLGLPTPFGSFRFLSPCWYYLSERSLYFWQSLYLSTYKSKTSGWSTLPVIV